MGERQRAAKRALCATALSCLAPRTRTARPGPWCVAERGRAVGRPRPPQAMPPTARAASPDGTETVPRDLGSGPSQGPSPHGDTTRRQRGMMGGQSLSRRRRRRLVGRLRPTGSAEEPAHPPRPNHRWSRSARSHAGGLRRAGRPICRGSACGYLPAGAGRRSARSATLHYPRARGALAAGHVVAAPHPRRGRPRRHVRDRCGPPSAPRSTPTTDRGSAVGSNGDTADRTPPHPPSARAHDPAPHRWVLAAGRGTRPPPPQGPVRKCRLQRAKRPRTPRPKHDPECVGTSCKRYVCPAPRPARPRPTTRDNRPRPPHSPKAGRTSA